MATNNGKVDLQAMQPFLAELEERAGGVNAAARLVGVSPQSYMRWQGRLKWVNARSEASQANMTKQSAALVLVTLIAVRRKDRDSPYVTRINETLVKQALREQRFLRQIGCG